MAQATAGSITSTTVPIGDGGWQCTGCGLWVTYGNAHQCGGNYQYPSYYYQPINMQPLIHAINELTKEVKKLQDIIADV